VQSTSIVLLTIHQADRVLASMWAQNGKYSSPNAMATPEGSTMGQSRPPSQPTSEPSAPVVLGVAEDCRMVRGNEVGTLIFHEEV